MPILKAKCLKKILCLLLVLFALFSGSLLTCSAATKELPFVSYTYWEDNDNKQSVYSKPVYQVDRIIDNKTLGEADLGNLSDISVDNDGFVYILTAKPDTVYILDDEYNLQKKIDRFIFESAEISFKDAKGIFVKDKRIYICDTGNERVLVSDTNGNITREIKCPESSIIPESFKFRPTHIAVDNNDYMYILCDGSYYGALLCTAEGEFLSFYGANLTETGLLAGLKKIWNKITMTNTKRSKSASSIPFQFSDLYIDSSNFIYTTTGSGIKKGQVKKLSPGGDNVFKTADYNYADKDIKQFNTEEAVIKRNFDLASIAVSKNGYMYLLDTTYGHIFLYDGDSNPLGIFGGGIGNGDQKGTFKMPIAIDTRENDVLVLDSAKKSVTVFKPTIQGENLMTARTMTIKGDYINSKPLWEQVLSEDKNCRLAYVGLAKVAFAQKDYKEALRLAKLGADRNVYSQSFKFIRDDFLRNYFGIIALALTALVVGAFALNKFVIKPRGISLGADAKIIEKVIFHPIDGFNEIRYKKSGSLKSAGIVLILFYIAKTLETNFGGFLFKASSTGSVNAIFLLLRTFGFVILWTFANRLVTTLLGGLGKAPDIFKIVCYSLIPMTTFSVLNLVLSNVLLLNEVAFLGVFSALSLLYAFILMLIGHLIIHDYSFSKTIVTFILTLLAMAIILFFGFIFIVLIQQLSVFLQTVFAEIINF